MKNIYKFILSLIHSCEKKVNDQWIISKHNLIWVEFDYFVANKPLWVHVIVTDIKRRNGTSDDWPTRHGALKQTLIPSKSGGSALDFWQQYVRKHPTRRLFKIAVLGGVFSWKIVGVFVKICKRPFCGKSELCSCKFCATFFRGAISPRKCDLTQYCATFRGVLWKIRSVLIIFCPSWKIWAAFIVFCPS